MWLRYTYCTEVNGKPGPAGGEFFTCPMNSNARLSSCQNSPEDRSCPKAPRLTTQQRVNTGRAHKYCFARMQILFSWELIPKVYQHALVYWSGQEDTRKEG